MFIHCSYIALMMLRRSDETLAKKKFSINLNCLTCMHLKLLAGHYCNIHIQITFSAWYFNYNKRALLAI